MRRQLLIVVCLVAALALLGVVSTAAGSTSGSKYKVVMNGYSLQCINVPSCDFTTVTIRRIDDDRTSCHPTVDLGSCKWTAAAGTKVVLEITAVMPDGSFTWGGDCSNTGPQCKIVMDSNKTFMISATWTGP